MEILVLEEESCIDDLLPFTSTRSVLDIRVGIFTFREKWELMLGEETFRLGDGPAFPANVLPTRKLVAAFHEEQLFGRPDQAAIDVFLREATVIRYPWHIFQHNAEALIEDFTIIRARHTSQPIPFSVQAICPDNIFIEEGARLQHCLLNASTGPI